jgi:hypothetical protein
VTAWTTRLGALVAVMALAVAPTARAACAARCAPGPAHATTPIASADMAAPAGGQHAHHHGATADAPPAPVSAASDGARVAGTRCTPDAGRDCDGIRETPAAPAGREAQDTVSLAAGVSMATVAAASPVVPPAHPPQPIRPPSPPAAPLPLRL